jgi:hypothetical protein
LKKLKIGAGTVSDLPADPERIRPEESVGPLAATLGEAFARSKAKAIDHSPGSVLRWRAYLDAAGKVRPLPAHVRVTNRGGKDRHYALMCWSDEPLVLSDYCAFDHSVHRNLSGAPIGATQVTALVRRISPDSATPLYRTGFGARLVESYWVKLVEAEPV